MSNSLNEESEQRVKQLEAPKTWDGCKYEYIDTSLTDLERAKYFQHCFGCARTKPDRYEPKDKWWQIYS